ncbi:substrate-binding domain-containing protein [Bradyrhizobium sp. WYCCWR 13023]|uniref:Substrate-binding domain-containing protein n=1 Tax=Bradyrhizobium zhengyangense TaxID=2911009 RepID=A0A9X1UEY3_9BRAD|nr:substrate-binding domain-containing protein [Bradyrhizobium zhengyangense]MCG2632473.1 substrate-binding domain-containing protein [Bradyrhizobium zhengyangense]MCG2672960.1 substrate-binding domain-containing protein [Bradyrhizobium zhengyangense]
MTAIYRRTATFLALGLVGQMMTVPVALAGESGGKTAQQYMVDVTEPNPPWTGPTTGPAAQKGKSIVYVSADQRNGGALGVADGVQEAASAIGWTVRVLDGQGTVSGRSTALQQAIALKPDGIVLGTVDAKEQAELIRQAADAGIKIVGWHSVTKPGPSAEYKLFNNIATDPLDVAKAAATFAVTDSDGKAGVVIFTDSTYAIAIAKSDAMAAVIKACGGCKVLSVEDTPLAEASTRMPQLTTSLLQRFGNQWTYALSINDLTFDFMSASLSSAGIAQDGYPRNVSAGDGSEAAFQRIRTKFYQSGTVAEPLHLHGWQAVDELNRAFAGQPASGFSAQVHLVIPKNIGSDGGPKNIYDPENGYRAVYTRIWKGR